MKTLAVLFLVLGISTQAHAQSAAKISILEFGDFQCPYTERAIAITDQIKADFGTQVQITFKNFPLVAIHPNAKPAALAYICASFQDHAQEMFNLLFANQATLSSSAYNSFAQSLGLDLSAFDACLTSASAEQSLDADIALANTYHVNATPTFIISNGKKYIVVVGAQDYSVFKADINRLL